jgi:hypothetical protein
MITTKVYKKNILISLLSIVFFIFINIDDDVFAIDDEQTLIFSEYLASDMVFINRGQNLIADKGLLSAISSVAKNSMYGTSYFGAVSLETSKQKVASGLNVNGIALISGLVQKINILTAGAFFEYGNGNYDSVDTFENLPSIKGNGDKEYIGGGLICHLDLFGKLYLDFSSRKGLLKTDFYSFDLVDIYYDFPYIYYDFAYYDCDLTYFGSHAGLGYKLDFTKKLKLNIFSKYFFTHQDGQNDVILYTGEVLNFYDIDSQRLLCGVRTSMQASEIFSFYSGLSAEYEFLGDVKATFENKDLVVQTLKGYTKVIEVGILGKSNSCNAELSFQSYLGVKEGFAGTFKISFAFFNYMERFLGYSLEKFENEKIGRFSNSFSFSKKKCFFKLLEIIKELNGRVTHKNFKKGYIVAFDFSKSFQNFCLDSTEACIYIENLEGNNVKVEVVSNNDLLADELSKKLFQMLSKDKEEKKEK